MARRLQGFARPGQALSRNPLGKAPHREGIEARLE